MKILEKVIKKIVEDNCKKNMYLEKFSPEMQVEIKEKSDLIAKITMEDEDLVGIIQNAIEESIRVMILRKDS